MEIIRSIKNAKLLIFYLEHRNIITVMFILFFLVMLVLIKVKFGKLVIINGIYSTVRDVFLLTFSGLLVYILGIRLPITREIFTNVLFLVLLIILIYGLFGLSVYKKSSLQFLFLVINALKKCIYLTIIVLAGNGTLYIRELLILVTGTYILDLLRISFSTINSCNLLYTDKINMKDDSPIENESFLFESRKNQLRTVQDYLVNQDQAFQSIAINGAWGQGKTSFVYSLMESMSKEVKIVYIDPNIDSDLESMLKQLVMQLEKHLAEEGIYSGRGSSLDKYIKFITTIISNGSFEWINELSELMVKKDENGLRELRESLEYDIFHLNKTSSLKLVIVVDDLDRCESGVIREVIKFFNSVFSLKGCTLLFLVDIKQIGEVGVGKEYLEKYITDRVELTEIDNDIIANFYIDRGTYLSEDLFGELEDIIVKQLKEFVIKRRYIASYYIDRIEQGKQECQNKLSKINKDNGEKEIYLSRIKTMDEFLIKLKKNVNNPRRVKRFFRDLERGIKTINYQWFKNFLRKESDYNKLNWIEIASSVSFIKAFIEEEFDVILKYTNIEDYMRYGNNYVTEYIFETGSLLWASSDKIMVINKLLFEIYLPSGSTDLKESQTIQAQLNKGYLDTKYIMKTFENIFWSEENREEYMRIILSSIKNLENNGERKNMIIDLYEKLSRMTSSSRSLNKEFFNLLFKSTDIVGDAYELKEINHLVRLLDMISEHFIFGSSNYIQIIFEIDLDRTPLNLNENLDKVRTFEQLTNYIRLIYSDWKLKTEKYDEEVIKFFESMIERLMTKHKELKDIIISTGEKLIKNLEVSQLIFEEVNRITGIQITSSQYNYDFGNIKDYDEFIMQYKDLYKNEISDNEVIDLNSKVVREFGELCQNLDNYGIEINQESLIELIDVYGKINDKIERNNEENLWWAYTRVRLYKRQKR